MKAVSMWRNETSLVKVMTAAIDSKACAMRQ